MREILQAELSGIAWNMVVVAILAAALAVIWKLIERKLLTLADKKAYEIKKKKLDEANAAQKIHADNNGPTYEEWKSAKELEENEKR